MRDGSNCVGHTSITFNDAMSFLLIVTRFELYVFSATQSEYIIILLFWYGQLVVHQPYALYLCVCACARAGVRACVYLRVRGHDHITPSYVIT